MHQGVIYDWGILGLGQIKSGQDTSNRSGKAGQGRDFALGGNKATLKCEGDLRKTSSDFFYKISYNIVE